MPRTSSAGNCGGIAARGRGALTWGGRRGGSGGTDCTGGPAAAGGAVVVWGAASGAGRGGSGVSVDSGAASRGGCSSGAVMLTGEIDFEHGKSQSTGTGTWPAGRSQIAVYFFTCSSKV